MRFVTDSKKPNMSSLLQGSRIFSDFTANEINRLSDLVNPQIKNFKSGTTIQGEDTFLEYVFLILEGTVSGIRRKHCKAGHELCFRHVGDTVGLFAFFSESRKTYVEISALNDVTALFFEIKPLLEMQETRYRVVLAAGMEIIRLTRQDIMRVDALLADNSRDRIEIFLKDHMDDSVISLAFSQEETARYLNINRTTFSKELGLMKKDGTLEPITKRKFIYHGVQEETM